LKLMFADSKIRKSGWTRLCDRAVHNHSRSCRGCLQR
jgi:hypothetical protein